MSRQQGVTMALRRGELPDCSLYPGQREVAPEDFALHRQGDNILPFRPVAGSPIHNPHPTRSLLDGTLMGEESQGMIDDFDCSHVVIQRDLRWLLKSKCRQDVSLLPHEVPVNPIGRGMLLDDEMTAHAHCDCAIILLFYAANRLMISW